MRTRTIVCVTAALAFALPFAMQSARSQQDPAALQQPTPEQMGQMMKEWMAMMSPGPMHKELAKKVGKWDTTTKTWWAGPSGPPTETKGTSKITSVLSGRFIHEHFTGTMPMPDPATGQMKDHAHEGMGMTGYDNYRNLFVGTWSDSMSTAILTMRGTMPPGSKTLTMYGEMDEPQMKMTGRTVKYETRFVDDDNYVFTIYDLAAGPDYKVFEITYKRRK